MQKSIIRSVGAGLNTLSLVTPRAAARKAFNLFVTPPKLNIRTKEREFLATAARHQRGESMVYSWGDAHAPYVLLAYGWGYNAGRWRHFVPQIVESGLRVIAFDPPGHGNAMKSKLTLPRNAELIQSLIREYGQARAIIGHSFGGASAVVALRDLPRSLHPDRFVLMAAFSRAMAVFEEYRDALGMSPGLFASYLKLLREELKFMAEEYDMAQHAAELDYPTALIIHDPDDPVTNYREALRYHSLWPGSLLFSPKNAGHHLGTPEVTNAAISFVLRGSIPDAAQIQQQGLAAGHELTRWFADLVVGMRK